MMKRNEAFCRFTRAVRIHSFDYTIQFKIEILNMNTLLNPHREIAQIARINKARIYDNLLNMARLLFLPASLGLNLFEKCFNAIQQLFKQSEAQAKKGKPLVGIKLAMLAHTILLYQDYSVSSSSHHKKIYEALSDILSRLQAVLRRSSHKDKRYQYARDSIVCLYIFYLQKKLYFLKDVSERSEWSELQVSSQSCFQFDGTAYDRSCRLINLLGNGVLLVEGLLHYMRYYLRETMYLLDLSLLLAQDFSRIYEQITHYTHECRHLQGAHLTKNNLAEMLKDIEKLHEPLQMLYLNRYSNRMLAKYRPTWIKTDTIQTKPSKHDRVRKSTSLNSSATTECTRREQIFQNLQSNSRAEEEPQTEAENTISNISKKQLEINNLQILKDLQANFHQKFSQQNSAFVSVFID